MSFIDKAKEKIEEIKDRFDAPDKPGVGEEQPSDAGEAISPVDDPALGADPDLNTSREDRYDAD